MQIQLQSQGMIFTWQVFEYFESIGVAKYWKNNLAVYLTDIAGLKNWSEANSLFLSVK